VCDLETSRIGAPYIYDISSLRVKIDLREMECEDVVWNFLFLAQDMGQ